MTKAIPDIKKNRGRPKTGIGQPILVRFPPDVIQAIDAEIETSGGTKETRPDFVRRSVAEKLSRK